MNKTQKIGSYVILGAVVVVGGLFATGVIKFPESPAEVFQKVAQAESQISSSEVSLTVSADISAPSSSTDGTTQSIHLDGTFDGAVNKGSDSPAESMHFAVSESSPDTSPVSVEGNVLLVNKMAYLEATKLPSLPIDTSAFLNKWISFDIIALAKQSDNPMLASELETSLGAKGSQLPTQFYIDAVKLASTDGFIKSVTPAGAEVVSGVPTNAYTFTFDTTKLATFIPDYITLWNNYIVKAGGTGAPAPTFTADETAMFSQISLSGFKVWIGQKDYLPYRITGTVNLNNLTIGAVSGGAGLSGSISLDETVKGYNTNPVIAAPTTSMPFDQFLKSVLGISLPDESQ